MNAPRSAVLLLLASLLSISVALPSTASDKSDQQLNKDGRIEIIRGMEAEHVFVRTMFPMGTTGLTLKNGKIVAPKEGELRQLLADFGPSLKPGDRAQISNIIFKSSAIRFEINGGPAKKKKWYQHIEVGGMGGSVPIAPTDPNANPRGSYVDLVFDKRVPELTPKQLETMLAPVFDFSAHSSTEAYIATLPPKAQQAIKDHKVLVGMDKEMVLYAKGRPPKKVRENDGKSEYEEWIYGEPPQEVEFVRLVGNEVVRVETMKVDGQKLVRTQKEVDIKPAPAATEANAQGQQPLPQPSERPSLRRPGEQPDEDPNSGPLTPKPQPGQSPTPVPSSGPSLYRQAAASELHQGKS